MALGTRPYKVFVVSKFQDANNAWCVNVEVRDSAATPTVRAMETVPISPPEELMDRLQFVLLRAYVKDVGSIGGFLDALISNSIPVVQL